MAKRAAENLAEELRATQAALLGPPRCAGCQPECRDFVRKAIDTALEPVERGHARHLGPLRR